MSQSTVSHALATLYDAGLVTGAKRDVGGIITLSLDKAAVFEEAYRVLRPGGRLAISDVVMTAEVPAEFRADPESVVGCVAGAATIPALEGMLAGAGFEDVQIVPKDESCEIIREWSADHDLDEYIVLAMIEGRKPERQSSDKRLSAAERLQSYYQRSVTH